MGLTVFVIDDDMVSQFATRYCLQQYHDQLEVVVCGSAEEGLERCERMLEDEKKLPDLIFLDLTMGEMDGWGFIDNLNVISRGYDCPKIFILSAFSNAKDREVAKNHNSISGFFNKPLTRGNLDVVFDKNEIS